MSSTITPYLYYANPVSVTDGDTITVDVDLGFSITKQTTVRLLNINTAEVPSWIHFDNVTWDDIDLEENPQFQLAKDQTEFVRSWLDTASERSDGDWDIIIDTEKSGKGKFGRILADFYRRGEGGDWNEADSLGDVIVDEFGEDVIQFY